MMEGKHFDEMQVGDKFTTLARTVTEADLVNFVALGGFYEELFMNKEYAEQSIYKTRIAPGALTFTIAEGLSIQTGILHNTGMAFLGLNMRILAPTRVNDTIRVDIEVTEKRTSSDPSRGIVTFTHTVRNQDNQAIMTYNVTRMIKKRDS